MRGRGPFVGRFVRNSQVRRSAGRSAFVAALLAVVVAACAGAAPSPTPVATPAPTPSPTPNPHLVAPASVDAVFTWLNAHGLRIIGNNADGAMAGGPQKRINATYAGWPLILSEYATTAAARTATGIRTAVAKAGADQSPFTFVGLNIVVDFGPRLRRATDPAPETRFVGAATTLAAALDPLLGPLTVRSVVAIALPPGPAASPGAGSPTPSGSPKATPKPKPKPKPKASGKPKATTRPKATPTPSA
jgi:hypothetical protein